MPGSAIETIKGFHVFSTANDADTVAPASDFDKTIMGLAGEFMDLWLWAEGKQTQGSGEPLSLRDAAAYGRIIAALAGGTASIVSAPGELNGKPAILFDGTSDGSIETQWCPTSSYFCVFALRNIEAPGEMRIMGQTGNSGLTRSDFRIHQSSATGQGIAQSGTIKHITGTGNSCANDTDHVGWWSYNAADDTIRGGWDNVAAEMSDTIANAIDPINPVWRFGGSGSGANFFSGKFGSVIFLNTHLHDDTAKDTLRTKLVSAIGAYYGVTISDSVVVEDIFDPSSALGEGVSIALAKDIGTSGAVVVQDGALGEPISATLTHATGLPISTGVTGLGAGVAPALAVEPNLAGGLVGYTDFLRSGVISRSLSAPPGSPATGDRYIVGPAATGAWSGHDDQIAEYRGAWGFTAPGLAAGFFVVDEGAYVGWNGSAWVVAANPTYAEATLADLLVTMGSTVAGAEGRVWNDVIANTVSWSVTSNVVSVVTAASHGLGVGVSRNLRGMATAALNGRITTVSGTTGSTIKFALTYADTGSTADTGGQVDQNGVYSSDGAGGLTWLADLPTEPGLSAETSARIAGQADLLAEMDARIPDTEGAGDLLPVVFDLQRRLAMWARQNGAIGLNRLELLLAETENDLMPLVGGTGDKIAIGIRRSGLASIRPDADSISYVGGRLIADDLVAAPLLNPIVVPTSVGVSSVTAVSHRGEGLFFLGLDDGEFGGFMTRRDIEAPYAIADTAGPIKMILQEGDSTSVGFTPESAVWSGAADNPRRALMFNVGARPHIGIYTLAPEELIDFAALHETGTTNYRDTGGQQMVKNLCDLQEARGARPSAWLFVTVGQAGAKTGELYPGTQPYINGSTCIDALVRIAAEYDREAEVPYVSIISGLNDRSQYTRTTLLGRFTTWVTGRSADIIARTGQTTPPVFILEQAITTNDNAAPGVEDQLAPALAMYDLVKSRSDVVTCGMAYWIKDDFGLSDTNPPYAHKYSKAYALWGEVRAEIIDVLESGGEWHGFRPESVSRTGAVVTITYYSTNIVSPLLFNIAWLPMAPNYGYYAYDDDGPLTFSSITSSGLVVTATLSAVPDSDKHPRIGYVNKVGPGTTDRRAGTWGNLCDSAAIASDVIGTRAHWAIPFDEAI